MRTSWAITKRELRAYFTTPLAYVFIVIFLALNGVTAFYFGGLFDRGQADMQPLFGFLPWLYLFLIPAVAMRLWAEERKAGTLELLMTLPVSTFNAVFGKFLAAWIFTGIALALTFPVWITVNYLGDPDNGVIIASYLGGFLMAGSYLAIGGFVSAMTRNQVIAFVIGAAVIFLFMMSGLELVQSAFRGWAPDLVVDLVRSFSFLVHYDAIVRGVIDIRDLIFFISIIGVFLFANMVVVDLKKGS
ncbi:MAG: ABC transporter permease [Rhodospirillaceae bacterium]|nr:ABC transporter permease [Rhodospirillaceae bacterium]MBI77272.1 ABC transporter permease [Rhodospirillaceae bacterium]|tara:strand:+ start:520 stop:1254 length:735 start_codon:yes stop_codon:yes gene_type:complete